MKKVGGRFLLLALVVVLSVFFFIPSYQPFYQGLPAWLKQVMPNKGITLGLDLQGGIHLVMDSRGVRGADGTDPDHDSVPERGTQGADPEDDR
jgi:preprotein translocase subunit SecD